MHRAEGFRWWIVLADGTAEAVPDSPEICKLIDSDKVSGKMTVYGTIEGAILYGGVMATAVSRRTSKTYDAAHWLKTGEMKEAGIVVVTRITAMCEIGGDKVPSHYEKHWPPFGERFK
jgi:hypothetical protein